MDRTGGFFLVNYYYQQQRLYEEGYPSIWGFWNHMAEYLLYGPRRIQHHINGGGSL